MYSSIPITQIVLFSNENRLFLPEPLSCNTMSSPTRFHCASPKARTFFYTITMPPTPRPVTSMHNHLMCVLQPNIPRTQKARLQEKLKGPSLGTWQSSLPSVLPSRMVPFPPEHYMGRAWASWLWMRPLHT